MSSPVKVDRTGHRIRSMGKIWERVLVKVLLLLAFFQSHRMERVFQRHRTRRLEVLMIHRAGRVKPLVVCLQVPEEVSIQVSEDMSMVLSQCRR